MNYKKGAKMGKGRRKIGSAKRRARRNQRKK